MSTTKLFVELLIIGLGPAIALLLLLLPVLHRDSISIADLTFSPWMMIPSLGLVYIFGIITDRLSDTFLHKRRFSRKIEEQYQKFLGGELPKGNTAIVDRFFSDRIRVLGNEKINELYEYSRHRQRICRSWTVNSPLVLVSMLASYGFYYTGPSEGPLLSLIVLSVVLAVVGVFSWRAWEVLVDTEMIRISRQVRLLSVEDEPAANNSNAEVAPDDRI
jgi:hypothetical protein